VWGGWGGWGGGGGGRGDAVSSVRTSPINKLRSYNPRRDVGQADSVAGYLYFCIYLVRGPNPRANPVSHPEAVGPGQTRHEARQG